MYTKNQIVKGFERWEQDCKNHPNAYVEREGDSEESRAECLIKFIENPTHTFADRESVDWLDRRIFKSTQAAESRARLIAENAVCIDNTKTESTTGLMITQRPPWNITFGMN